MSMETLRPVQVLGLFFSALAITVLIGGCDTKEDKDNANNTNTSDAADDGHNHAHVHGPHNGEVFEIPESGLYGEWVGKYDQNLIHIYILDTDQKTEKAIKADQIILKSKGRESQDFTVPAVDLGEDGMASEFQLENEILAMAMKNAGVDFEIVIDGNTFTGHIHKDPH